MQKIKGISMTLHDIEKYWIDSSNDDFDTAKTLFNNKKYTGSMFFLHLSLEKMLKGVFVNQNTEEPPFTHNLQKLGLNIGSIDKEKMVLLAQITTFNIAARYDDYKREFHKICDKKFAEKYLKLGEELLKWLKSQMK